MKILLAGVFLLPLCAGAEGYVEAVETAQVTGLENTYPAWSPDGSRIVFESTRDGPDADIFVMSADGSNLVQLTRNDAHDGTPAWTPDGGFIVFASERDGNEEVYRMRADGSSPVNLTRHPGADGRRVTDLPDWDTYPTVSPDGTQLLWRRIAPTGGKSESGRNSEVFWMDLTTGERKNLSANQAYDGWPAWSPDGRRVEPHPRHLRQRRRGDRLLDQAELLGGR